ncbi:MAG: hypothetical protein JXO22_05515, partial [Phycisphaerae bacterium]|nr:hypothetical protein [Phycisphaerae bacterium]
MALGLAAISTGCAGLGSRTVSLATLEQAPPAPLPHTQRVMLCDAAELGSCYQQLEPRLGLIRIHKKA